MSERRVCRSSICSSIIPIPWPKYTSIGVLRVILTLPSTLGLCVHADSNSSWAVYFCMPVGVLGIFEFSVVSILVSWELVTFWCRRGVFWAVRGDQSHAVIESFLLYWLEWKKCKLVRIPLNIDEISNGGWAARELSWRNWAAISHRRSRYCEAKGFDLNRQSRSVKEQGKSRIWKSRKGRSRFTDQLSILKVVDAVAASRKARVEKRKGNPPQVGERPYIPVCSMDDSARWCHSDLMPTSSQWCHSDDVILTSYPKISPVCLEKMT
jgi:hypothetical protein